MEYVLAGLVVLFVLGLVVGAVSGRVNVRSCCSPADPSRDLRMRDAYAPGPSEPPAQTEYPTRST